MITVSGTKILEIAAQDIGYHESAGKRNKFGAWYGMDGVAWCMEAVQYWYAQAGMRLPYKTASCSGLLNWYKAVHPECIVSNPEPGCIVIFDLPGTKSLTDHVGLFEAMDRQYITTIDGNTSSKNDANGGYVNRRTRQKNYVHAYIKPRGLVEMTDKEVYEAYNRHAATLPLPTSWDAAGELREAVELGITDGSNPMLPTPKYQAAIMDKRAYKKAVRR